jgi:CHAT domain-containing protein
VLYNSQGKYAEAEPLYKRSIEISEKALGPDHPDVAAALNNLAELYRAQGKYAEAEPLYKRSLAIWEKALGPDHPYVAGTLNNLAVFNAAQGKNQEALRLSLKANAVEDKVIRDIFSFASERERFLYLGTIQGNRDGFITLCAERLGDTEEGREAVLEYLLARKGLVLDSLLQDAEAARLSNDPGLKDLFEKLRATKNQLAKLALAGPGAEGTDRYRARMEELQEQGEAMEKELARKSSRFRAERETTKIGLTEVSSALTEGSALVEFAKYRSIDFGAKGKESQWGSYRYIACVLKRGEKTPSLISLGEADAIEGKILEYRKALDTCARGEKKAGDLNRLSGELEKLVWSPLIAALGKAKRVYLSPDGELNFVSFAGLKDDKGKYLLEEYDLAYVSSGRDLARVGLKREVSGRTAALFGAPEFEGRAASEKELLITRGGAFRSELASVRYFGGLKFDPLPGTREEVESIARMTKGVEIETETNLGVKASEGKVKALREPEVLHLATHGFFLPESGWREEREEKLFVRGFGERTIDMGKWKLENPMHRSGLALSGANLTLAGKGRPEDEDGILTAEEVAGLDLAGTKLAVLSACETGLGEAKGGEGVLGLRRAFVKAGAENLVMALWSVPDVATRDLMESFYGKYLAGQPPDRALLAAQREVLAGERAAGQEPNPYLWAAFVSSGVGVK